jgi:GntR family transcriptional regulator, transcriptional repressor for pyruvate dehydrogenase complex
MADRMKAERDEGRSQGRGESGGVVFDRLGRNPRLADQIAEKLLESILDGRFRAGDVLPSERELGSQFGVSRTVIREAIRSLSTRGVVRVESGRGVRVVPLGLEPVTAAMSLLIRGSSNVTFAKLHDVRTMLETHIAALAAERASDDDCASLASIVQEMRGVTEEQYVAAASRLDVDFHRCLARLTSNELYLVLVDSLGGLLLEMREATLAIPHNHARWLAEHERICDAVERHDPDRARAEMEHHLANVAESWHAWQVQEQSLTDSAGDGERVALAPQER